MAALACKDIERPDMTSLLLGGGGNRIGVVSSDFGAAGRFSLISPEGFPLPGFAAIHSDAVARYQDGRVYIINRLNRDNIQTLQPNLGFLTELEFSTGAGTNPQDIIKVNDSKAYISLYNGTELLIVHPASGAKIGAVSLAAYADNAPIPDGLPEMSGMHLEGNLLYVALQRLDRNDPSGRFPPYGSSLLIEINTDSETVSAVYTFPGRNPFGKLRRVIFEGAPHLICACPGRMGFISELDGGVAAFNLTSKTFRPGFIYAETAAGGDILDVALKNDEVGYAIVLDSRFNKFLHRFRPGTGERTGVIAAFPESAGVVAGLLLTPDGKLFAGSADFTNPGVMIYDTDKNDSPVTPLPVSAGLRPADLILISP